MARLITPWSPGSSAGKSGASWTGSASNSRAVDQGPIAAWGYGKSGISFSVYAPVGWTRASPLAERTRGAPMR